MKKMILGLSAARVDNATRQRIKKKRITGKSLPES